MLFELGPSVCPSHGSSRTASPHRDVAIRKGVRRGLSGRLDHRHFPSSDPMGARGSRIRERHLSRQVGFEMVEMHEYDVGQMPRVPPSLIMFPDPPHSGKPPP